ncbi:cysteine hydrolase [Sphingomonas sp. H39-1-10]|uniref:cysteine hydrolase family protein n=1 Tax=Sphingomonas pollutisoli TaxID=3030829 RepID=UPI0023B986A4|nr:isochorismatase family cysteine hydrolase [Sphingomonas pollutisoli]MDF0489643.1 cysteine hydrolase [Sphingomonas pollutisoli]
MYDAQHPDPATAATRDQKPERPALLIIDMINRFDFPQADQIKPGALAAARVIAKLRETAERAGYPVVFVNDNFGEWHSERSRLIDSALTDENDISAALRPNDDDYFIIKPQFSGFYATNLPVLLPKLGVNRLILTGIATDICVLFTAADAHMRDYDLWIPEDAVAAETAERGRWALEIMANSMTAETRPTSDLSLDAWVSRAQADAPAQP